MAPAAIVSSIVEGTSSQLEITFGELESTFGELESTFSELESTFGQLESTFGQLEIVSIKQETPHQRRGGRMGWLVPSDTSSRDIRYEPT